MFRFTYSFLLMFLSISLVSASVNIGEEAIDIQGVEIVLKSAATALSGNLTNFTQLEDTPSTYVGDGGECVKVNGGETGLEFGSCGTGTGSSLNASGIYLFNDSTTIFFNSTQAGIDLEVNASEYWGAFNSANTTQFENQGGILHILDSWFETVFNLLFSQQTTDNLTEGLVNLYDNQSWNQGLADTLYYNISNPLNFINSSSTGLNASGIYLFNDSTTIFFNTTRAGLDLEVNASDYWDGLNTTNTTQFENQGGMLHILDSWFETVFNLLFSQQTTDNLTEGLVNFYDNQSWNQSLADTLYYNISNPLNFINSSANPFDQNLNTTANVSFNQINVTDEIFINNFNVSLAIANAMGSGLIDGGFITIGTDPSKFDVGTTKSWFVNNTNPIPDLKYVECAAFDEVTIVNILTAPRTDIALLSDCTLEQKTTPFTNAERRSRVVLGRIVHANNINITVTVGLQHYGLGVYDQYLDLTHAIGNINPSGNIYSAGGSGLTINRTSGTIFRIGANYENTKDNPNEVAQDAEGTVEFVYRYRDGSGGFTQTPFPEITDVDVDSYDDGSGTLATVPNNRFSIQRIYLFSDNATVLQYGQAIYNKLSQATAAISTEEFTADPNLELDAVLRGWIVVKGSTTDLSDISDTKIINAGKFGNLGGGTGTSAAQEVDLQNAYDNSDEPELVLTSTNNGLTIRDASSPLGVSLLEVQNFAGDINYFNVSANGVFENDSRVCTLKNGLCNFTNSNIFNQSLNTTDNVTFNEVTTTGTIHINNSNGAGTLIVQGQNPGANFAAWELWSNDTSPKIWQGTNRFQPGSIYTDNFQFWNFDGSDWFRAYEILNVTKEWGINMDAVLNTMFSVNGTANFTGNISTEEFFKGSGEYLFNVNYTETDALAYNGSLRGIDNLTFIGDSQFVGNVEVLGTDFLINGTNAQFTLDGRFEASSGRTPILNLIGARNGGNNDFATINAYQRDDSGTDVNFIGGQIAFEESGADDTQIRIYIATDTVLDLAITLDQDGLTSTKDITITSPFALNLGNVGAGGHPIFTNKSGLQIGDAASSGTITFAGGTKNGKVIIQQLAGSYSGGFATVCVDNLGLLTAVDGSSC